MPSITHPRQLVLITSRATVDIIGESVHKDNITATTFHMPCSLSPKSYCVSLLKTSFSAKLIKESKVFVVNFVPIEFKKEVDSCIGHSGEHMNKFEKAGLEKEEADKIDCQRLKNSSGYLECEVTHEIEIGDNIIFVGKVVNSMLHKPGKRLFLKEEGKYTTTID